MAAFAGDLVRASLFVLDAFEQFRSSGQRATRTDIELGLHAGTCYAVTANGLLDHSGNTVNTAARLQAEAKGGS